MESLIIIVHVLAAIGITGLVLLQQGKGADMGASFGSGASQTLFGSVGSSNALTKSTAWLAVIFFATSLGLALIAKQRASQGVTESALIENRDQIETLIDTAPAGDLPVAPASEATGSDLPQLPADAAAAVEATADAALDAVAEVAGELAADTADAVEAGVDTAGAAAEQAAGEAEAALEEAGAAEQE
jgi:preprotein translocase subunit SecG